MTIVAPHRVSGTSDDSYPPPQGAGRLVYRDPLSPADIAVPVMAARMTEFFTFFVYAIASVIVFPQLFFPAGNLFAATMMSFAIFSLAFLFRPIGTFLFNRIGDRFGRGPKLVAAIFLLGGSTMAVAFLPTYAEVGVTAAILLALTRIGQGLGLGGTWDGLVLLMSLNSPERQRGWYAAMAQLGAGLGFLLASVLFIVLLSTLKPEEFMSWGWRFPFFIVLVLNVLALFSRMRLLSTSDFNVLEERGELERRSLGDLLSVHAREVITGIFLLLASFALFHMVTVFPLGWAMVEEVIDPLAVLKLQAVGAIVMILTIMASGLLADRIGRKAVIGGSAVLIAVFSLTAPRLLAAGEEGLALYIFLGFALLGLSFGQASAAAASRFLPGYRYSGAQVVSDIAWLTGAAFAPLVALGLGATFGLAYAGYYLLSGAVVTLIALAFSDQLDMKTPIRRP